MQLLRSSQSASCCPNRPHTRRVVVCQASTSQSGVASTSRRVTLLACSSILGGLFVARQAQAVCADLDTAEAGDACRQKELAADEGKGFKGDYGNLTSGPARRTAANVPVSQLGQQYVKDTLELTAAIDTYITMDVYDKKRQPLIKQLKADALGWVSKYARGGSVRAQSARQIYIACDAVLGHLASNGLAPLPKNKANTVREVIDKGLAFLDDGK